MADIQLAVIMCPTHRVRGLQLVRSWGGVRLTRRKCCGSWKVMETFTVDAAELVNEVQTAEAHDTPSSRDGGRDG